MLLHWVIAALILGNIALIYTTHQLPDAVQGGLTDLHMSIGLTVLGLVLLRLLWRFSHRPPPLPAAYAPWERAVAHAAHITLYGVMLLLPISGWLHDSAWKDAPAHPYYWFGLFEWPRLKWIRELNPPLKEVMHHRFLILHIGCGYALYALLCAHIAGVLKHQILDREPELQRMIPRFGKRPGSR